MSAASNSNYEYYKFGGALSPNATSYVVRQGDTKLCEGLKAMKFCYVFNSRQMGKSSLRVRTMKTLQKEGFACITIEMRDICSYKVKQDDFYATIFSHLVSGFDLAIDEGDWWHKHEDISPFGRLSKFFHEELLEKITQNIVIFVDEIDSIINLEFKDDFFGFIRTCYNKRADHPKYNRLTFALLGVATPSDLIEDNTRTPFNIDSLAIELSGFQLYESKPLQEGLQGKVSNPKAVLKEVLSWTGGQPFLTQKLCKLILCDSSHIRDGDEERCVRDLVRSHVIDNWLTQDNPEHLRTIRNRIIKNKQCSEPLLKLYKKILQWGEVTADDNHNQIELQLSGLVVKYEGKLKVYNPIYKFVFNLDWVTKELKTLQPRCPILPVWTVLAGSMVVTLLVMGMRSLCLLQPLELKTFDQLMQLRPAEKPDPRLLIVEVTAKDIKQLGGEYPLHDRTLLRLLKKLEQYQPRVIGLDIYRNQPVGEGHANLVNYLKQNDRIIPLCIAPSDEIPEGVLPLPGILEEQLGFGDVAIDPDGIVRRHLLAMEPAFSCPTFYALSLQLALRYLKAEGISLQFLSNNYWQLGRVVLKKLKPQTGFYHQPEELEGFHVLLNYRSNKTPQKIAELVTLTEILTDRAKPDVVKDKIVLIGVTDPIVKDYFKTSYNQELRGLMLHAQMVSQLVSAVKDQRHLLSFFPLWVDALWVCTWSLLGGLLIWNFQSLLHRGIAVGALVIVLCGTSFLFLLEEGVLVPLVPSALALLTSGGWIVVYTAFKPNDHSNNL